MPVYSPLEIAKFQQMEAEQSLHFFVRLMWHVLEPAVQFADGWWPVAWCAHLEAVLDGRIIRLIGNVPPGSTKSLLTNVFFPAWIWGPKKQPHKRILTAAYSSLLTERDNDRLRTLIMSEEYQMRWGHVFKCGDSVTNLKTNKTGFKVASSVGGTITGQRGDLFIIDDPNNIADADSKIIREATNQWLGEVMPTRMNDMEKSAIILIQQRTHEEDATGYLINRSKGGDRWCYVMCPMEYDPGWTAGVTDIGWKDPRSKPGELFWPARFSARAVMKLKADMTDYAWAGQMQQHPEPRGGAIVKRAWWQLYGKLDEDPVEVKLRYPAMTYVVASLDCALTDKDENDPSALVVLGVWNRPENGAQAVMVLYAWEDRLQLNPLTKRVQQTCEKWRVDRLIIENKASGESVRQELRRLFSRADYGITMYDPTHDGDKVARTHSVTHLFEEKMIWRPNTEWADKLVDQVSIFPKGSHDDQVDALVAGLRHLRDIGAVSRRQEAKWHDMDLQTLARGERFSMRPLYPV